MQALCRVTKPASPLTFELRARAQGALTSVLEYEWKIKLPLSSVFCAGLCGFLIRARGKLRGVLVGGLEPRSRKSGNRKFLGGSDRSPRIIKWQGMKLLTFFVACLCQLGGMEVDVKRRPEVKMRAPIYLNICFSETKKKQKTATQNMKHTTYLFSFVAVTNFRKWMDCFGFIFLKPSLRVQSCLLHISLSSYTQKFALWDWTSHYRRPQQ